MSWNKFEFWMMYALLTILGIWSALQILHG